MPQFTSRSSALSRRRLLRDGSLALAAAALAPAALARRALAAPFIHTAGKSGLEPLILGTGDHRYQCIHDWLTPPTSGSAAGLAFGDTHGLAQDAAGLIYVAHTVHPSSTKPHAVAVFGPDGTFQSAWGEAFRGGAHGLDLRAERGTEFLYHCDTNRRLVVKTDLKGETVWEAPWPKESGKYEAKEKYCPTNVAFLPDTPGSAPADILVGDGYGSSFIHRYSADGHYLKTIIGPGKEPGQVNCPHGLWIDSRAASPRLAVADRGNRRIQFFSLDGDHLGFAADGIRMPCHFKARGDLLLVPDLESVVTLLDKDNKPVVHLGDGARDGKPSPLRGAPRADFIPGKFIHPHTAIFLHTGDILVAEWVPIGRVTLLKRV